MQTEILSVGIITDKALLHNVTFLTIIGKKTPVLATVRAENSNFAGKKQTILLIQTGRVKLV